MPHPSVPIIGQPFHVLGGTAIVTIQCQCEAKTILTIAMGTQSKCPRCRHIYTFPNVELPIGIQVGREVTG